MQLKDYEKSIRKIQPKYMDALRDRSIYEKERDDAQGELKQIRALLEASKSKIDSLKEKNGDLETKLRASVAPEGPRPDLAQLDASGKGLQEAQSRIEALEKKLATAQKDMDYSREAYQRASSSASEMSVENSELRERMKQLEFRAGDNLAKIHQINAHNESREYQRLWEESRATLGERELELERVREELRVLQSGRRETRHPSVPRSPRMRVMRGGGPGPSGAGSRGSSPAPFGGSSDGQLGAGPGMTFFNQVPQSNARWGHLRE